MELNDFRPILDLMSQQEERYVKKFDEIHADVVETKNEAIKHNGRMRKLELQTHDLERDAQQRSTACYAKFEDMRPTIKTMKVINAIVSKPKTVIFTVLGFLITIQAIVIIVIEGGWLMELIKILK